jgi:hypothetical protein
MTAKRLGSPSAGGNFVDVSLGVVSQEADGTLIAFKSGFLHGTTQWIYPEDPNHIKPDHWQLTLANSRKAAEAYADAQKGPGKIFERREGDEYVEI